MPSASNSAFPSAAPEAATVWKALIMPKIVPSKPINGAIDATTDNRRRYLRSFSASRSPASWTVLFQHADRLAHF